MRTEKEKMLAGEYYDAFVDELVQDRERARELTYEFNQLKASEKAKKEEVIRKLIKAKGSFRIYSNFNCDYGYNIEVGDNFYANYNCTILDVNKVTIGDDVLLGPNVQIYTATHPIDPEERRKGLESGKAVTIGNNVWIGGSAVICPGVTIGDNVTIGAGSVVTRDIPSNVVAVGNPCRVIKEL